MNAEGLYGLFIYTMIPIAFIVVIGAKELGNTSLGLFDPNAIFTSFAGRIFSTGGSTLNWLVTIMLVVALSLSVLNSIMGCARALYQMAIDGQFPRIFTSVNRHGVPGFAMGFNVLFSLALIFTGGAVEIYSLSNVGYTVSFIPVLIGYYLLRKHKADARRPVRLPEPFKYIALGMAAVFFVIWLYGGIVYTSLPNALLDNSDTRIYFFIGWAILLSYVFFYWYRVKVEDPKYAAQGPTDRPEPLATGD